jgi:hypothetical protein
MRIALSIKHRLRGRRRLSSEEASVLASNVSSELGVHCDIELVVAVARPPNGRLNELVFQRLAGMFGVSPERLRTALFRDVI